MPSHIKFYRDKLTWEKPYFLHHNQLAFSTWMPEKLHFYPRSSVVQAVSQCCSFLSVFLDYSWPFNLYIYIYDLHIYRYISVCVCAPVRIFPLCSSPGYFRSARSPQVILVGKQVESHWLSHLLILPWDTGQPLDKHWRTLLLVCDFG